MNRFLNRIELVFISLVVVAALIIWATQALWITPGRHCEAAGNWWDGKTRICGHVIYLPDVTHRPIGSRRTIYPDLPSSRADAAQAGSAPMPPAASRAAVRPR